MTSFAQTLNPRRGTVRAAALMLVAASGLLAAALPATAAAEVGYEQVTPQNKKGGVVGVGSGFIARADGEALLYTAVGSFAGAPTESVPLDVRYVASRCRGLAEQARRCAAP